MLQTDKLLPVFDCICSFKQISCLLNQLFFNVLSVYSYQAHNPLVQCYHYRFHRKPEVILKIIFKLHYPKLTTNVLNLKKKLFSLRQIKHCMLGSGLCYLLFNIFLNQNVLFSCRHKTNQIHIRGNTAFVSQSLTHLLSHGTVGDNVFDHSKHFQDIILEISGKVTVCVCLLKMFMEKATFRIA